MHWLLEKVLELLWMVHVTDKKKDFAPGTHSAKIGNMNLIQLPDSILGNSIPFMPCTVQKFSKEVKVSIW